MLLESKKNPAPAVKRWKLTAITPTDHYPPGFWIVGKGRKPSMYCIVCLRDIEGCMMIDGAEPPMSLFLTGNVDVVLPFSWGLLIRIGNAMWRVEEQR